MIVGFSVSLGSGVSYGCLYPFSLDGYDGMEFIALVRLGVAVCIKRLALLGRKLLLVNKRLSLKVVKLENA